MSNRLNKLQFDWLVNGKESSTVFDIEKRHSRFPYFIPPEIGSGWGEMINTQHNVSLFRSECSFKQEEAGIFVSLADISSKSDNPSWAIQMATGGTIKHHDNLTGSNHVFGHGRCIIRYAKEVNFRPFAEKRNKITTSVLNLERDSLILMLGEQRFESLMVAIGTKDLPTVITHELPSSVSNLLNHAMLNPYQGKIRELFVQARALEFLCALSLFSERYSSVRPDSRNKLMAIYDLHDELIKLDGKVPALTELARKVGMSVRTMNHLFKETFGLSVRAFITKQRFEEAHKAIEESRIPLKVIAFRLGYSHVNHFITGFKKEFGYTPGSLR
ncbi:MAG: helix-turn-helix transcriptional regulator [Magnetococcus sp. THC-1_WYH]